MFLHNIFSYYIEFEIFRLLNEKKSRSTCIVLHLYVATNIPNSRKINQLQCRAVAENVQIT